MSDVRIDGDEIVVAPPFPEASELGARLDKKRGEYVLPATRANARAVADVYGPPGDVTDRLKPSRRVLAPVPGTATDRLYPYQLETAGRLVAAPRGQLVVLSPGLGKSAVAIVAADELLRPGQGVLVIAPAPLQRTWWREIETWGRTGHLEWAVETWDRAANIARMDAGRALGQWDVVVLDESVMMKGHQTKRFKSLRRARKHWNRVWLLSGNPATRYADDLWTQFHMIWPKAFPSYWRFARRYCVVEETPWGDKIIGNRRSRDPLADNDDLAIVVNQEEVLDLPEYLFETIDVALGARQADAYASMVADFVAELSDGTEVVAQNELAKIGRLQQITSSWDGESAKNDALIDLLQAYEAPHLIWTHWLDSARTLHDRMLSDGMDVSIVNGQTPEKTRDSIIEAFKDGQLEHLILSIGVGKFGHTLTNARTVWYVDKTWKADDYFQSLRRVRRIGLGHRPVVVTLRAPGTADDLVEANLEGKLTGISRMTRSDLAELLRGLGR